MAEKNVILKDGEDTLYPKTKAELVEGLTSVVANPTLAGTEADLTGLQVGDTKYKVPSGGGGGQLYRHHIRLLSGALTMNKAVLVSFISNSITPISSISELATFLYNNGFVGWIHPMKATSYKTAGYNDSICAIYTSDDGLTVKNATLNGTETNYSSTTSITDDVTALN